MTDKVLVRPRASAGQLVNRILEAPELVAAVRQLEPRALAGLIDHVGLEDSGELVALASTEQLARVFDEDLWTAERAGIDETFDADRFGLWLEVLLEAGEQAAAARLAELPEELLTLALQRSALVIDLEELALTVDGYGERYAPMQMSQLDKALESCLGQELDQYLIIARQHDGFDALVCALLALDQRHHDLLGRLLERCAYASAEYIEDNGGLYDVLTADEMLERDAAGDREERRAAEGYVAPSAATALLGLTRQTPLEQLLADSARDPVTEAYFRQLATPRAGRPDPRAAPAAHRGDDTANRGGLVALLQEAEVLRASPPAALLGQPANGADAPGDATALLREALASLPPRLLAARQRELAYLANVLVAGCALDGQRMRPLEAAEAALASCNLGLQHALVIRGGTRSDRLPRTERGAALVTERDVTWLFRVGWQLAFNDASLAAAHAIAALARRAATPLGGEDKAKLVRLAREADEAQRTRQPWRLRRRVRLVGELLLDDSERVVALRALLDQCPTLAGTLGRGGIWIATVQQLGTARRLLKALRD